MYNFIFKTGKIFVNAFTSLKDYLHFCFIIIAKFLSFHILNPAVFLVTLRQVYFTGVQIIWIIIFIAIVFGLVIVGFLGKFLFSIGAYDQIGKILVLTIIRELAPLVTAILLSFRSATAIGAEISMMKLNNEIKTLRSLGINEYDYLFLPRVFSGMVCSFSLAVFFAFIAVIVGYFLLSFKLNMRFDYIIMLIFNELNFRDIFCFIYKTLFFGFALVTIPIYTSMGVGKYTTDIPISLLKGMMRLFYGLTFVEFTGALI